VPTKYQAEYVDIRYVVVLVRKILFGGSNHDVDRWEGIAHSSHNQGGSRRD